jgi:hypothetical protein
MKKCRYSVSCQVIHRKSKRFDDHLNVWKITEVLPNGYNIKDRLGIIFVEKTKFHKDFTPYMKKHWETI